MRDPITSGTIMSESMKPKPHEDPHCLCEPCSAWILDQMDWRARASAQQQAEEDQQLFNALDRIAQDGFDPQP
jgi:hypothetical protein